MLFQLAVLVILAIIAGNASAQIVQIPNLGTVQGLTSQTAWTNRTIFEFRGIPYAVSPSGALRFKEPVRKPAWSGILDATKFGQPCPQPGIKSNSSDPEDCLTMDVYTPTLNSSAKLPVLVFIHGGAFLIGTSTHGRPGYVLEHDIVLVSPQYRLGPLGFFNLNIADVAGNMGLIDQSMAIQWVVDNIKNFGGDPTMITVSGTSAGAASATLQALSPRSQNKFRGLVSMSGSAIALWASSDSVKSEYHARNVAQLAGCNAGLPAGMMTSCLRKLSTDTIISATLRYDAQEKKSGRMGLGSYLPVVQRPISGVTPFLTDSPLHILETANYPKMPMLMSVCKHEGVFTFDQLYQTYITPNNLQNNEKFLREDIISAILKIYDVADGGRVLSDSILKQYFDTEDLGNFTLMTPSLIDFTGAAFIKGPSERQAELNAARGADTFFYSFEYPGQFTLHRNTAQSLPGVVGAVSHSDDTIYLFPRAADKLNEKDTVVSKRLVNALVNFVKYGNPSAEFNKMNNDVVLPLPRWPLFDSELRSYLKVDGLGDNGAILKSNLRKQFTDARSNGLPANPNSVLLSKITRHVISQILH